MKYVVCALVLLVALPAQALDFYTTGKDALEKRDYVTALKYLFAYRTAKLQELETHPEFLAELERMIQLSEQELRVGLKAKKEIVFGVTAAKGREIDDLLSAIANKDFMVVPANPNGATLEKLVEEKEKELNLLKTLQGVKNKGAKAQ